MREEIKNCVFCNKEIKLIAQKYVLLGTYEKKKPLDESYFHFQCFVEWYNKKVQEKAQNTIKGATEKAVGMFQGMGMGNLMGNLFGIKQVQDLDLAKENNIYDYETRIKKEDNKQKEKKDGRGKKIS